MSDLRADALSRTSKALAEVRAAWREAQGDRRTPTAFPSRTMLERIVEHLSVALFPRRLGAFVGNARSEEAFVVRHLTDALEGLEAQVATELAYWQDESGAAFDGDQATVVTNLFAGALPSIRRLIDSDVDAAFLGDPAARSVDEILVCYPGAIASLHHRIAHELDALGAPIIARIVSELANERTGIDIHPGATIGPSFFIDHGTGVVIGETAIIGARVRLYQHVTLGARSPLGAARHSVRDRFARHPIVEDDVVIYAGATILGRVTIGAGSTIGGNVWLLGDVPAHSVVTQPEASVLPHDDGIALREILHIEAGA
jgi:serine O-acetyltransferase